MGFYDAMRIGAVLVRGLFQQVAENGRVRRSSGYVTTLAGRRSSTRKGVAMRYSSDPLMAAATEAEDVGPPRRLLDGPGGPDRAGRGGPLRCPFRCGAAVGDGPVPEDPAWTRSSRHEADGAQFGRYTRTVWSRRSGTGWSGAPSANGSSCPAHGSATRTVR